MSQLQRTTEKLSPLVLVDEFSNLAVLLFDARALLKHFFLQTLILLKETYTHRSEFLSLFDSVRRMNEVTM